MPAKSCDRECDPFGLEIHTALKPREDSTAFPSTTSMKGFVPIRSSREILPWRVVTRVGTDEMSGVNRQLDLSLPCVRAGSHLMDQHMKVSLNERLA